MNFTRRHFIGTATAAALAPAWRLDAATAPNLRVGIVSDAHITRVSRGEWLDKALRYFDAQKVDAVAMTGDLALSGTVKEISATAEIWWKIFPNDRRSDGTPLTRLIVTGNHDVVTFPCYNVKTREQLAAEGFYCRREEAWRELFHEDYKPIAVKTVKGYDFVLRHWPLKGDPCPLAETLAALPSAAAKRPFFYLQHAPLDSTVNASWLLRGAWWDHGQDRSRELRKTLDAHPNAVVLSGHSHFPLTEEESIWQGAFTAVNCGCLRGNLFTAPGRENGTCEAKRSPRFEMRCFDERDNIINLMVMDVFDDRIVFHRRDLTNDETLADDWVVPLYAGGATVPPAGTPKFDPKARAAALGAPVFAADARVTVEHVEKGFYRTNKEIRDVDKENPHPQLKVVFPPITRANGSPSRGFDFSVRCLARIGDVTRIVDERRVYSPNTYFSEARDIQPCWCNFPVSGLPSTEELAFEVTPFNVFGKPGRPIRSAFKPFAKYLPDNKT